MGTKPMDPNVTTDLTETPRVLELSLLWGDLVLEKTHVRSASKGLGADDAKMEKRRSFDFAFARLFTVSLFAHAFFAVAALMTPNDANARTADFFNMHRASFVERILKKEPEPVKKAAAPLKSGSRAKDKEGLVGREHHPRHDTLAVKGGAPRIDPQ